MIYVFLADGFEESEAIVPADILMRGGHEVKFCSIYPDRKEVTGAHGIKVMADILPGEIKEADILIMPGGLGGTNAQKNSKFVRDTVKIQYENNKLIGAICAAPTILGEWGMLDDKTATCFPGMKDKLISKEYSELGAVKCKNIITGKSAGTCMEFGLELLKAISGEEVSEKVKNDMYIER